MKHQSIFRNFLITRRQFILSGFKITLLGLITTRLAYLQLIKHDKYSLLSKKNSIATTLIPPLRGEIFDRNGIALASNKQQFKLILNKSHTTKAKASLEKVFNLLNLSPLERNHIRSKIGKNSYTTTLINDLTWQQIVLISQAIFDLDFVGIVGYLVRLYPQDDSVSHPIGYTANATKVEDLDLKRLDNFQLGKSGIEKYYDKSLVGKFGYKEMEVDAHGNIMRQLQYTSSTNGESLTLSIDYILQKQVCQIMQDLSASVIVVDLQDQQILSLVSTPGFHANSFSRNQISQEYWQDLNTDMKLPLLNKGLQASYPPGSIFKLVTILAALDAGITPETKVTCKASGFLGNHFHCWNKRGHGPLDMLQALGSSCNYYMYHVAKTIGHKPIIKMAKKLGLGQKVGIDLPNEASGFLPKKSNLSLNWRLANTLNLSIGQGLITATPLQLSQLVSIIANKGQKINYLLKQPQTLSQHYIDVPTEHFEIIHQGMWRSVNHPSGTSNAARGKMIAAGKTGTSQVQSKKHASDDFNLLTTPWEQRNHALFVCFAPFDKPKYSVTVVVDHGGAGGKVAAPKAREILNLLA
jgi:penicillin-binding protein 2